MYFAKYFYLSIVKLNIIAFTRELRKLLINELSFIFRQCYFLQNLHINYFVRYYCATNHQFNHIVIFLVIYLIHTLKMFCLRKFGLSISFLLSLATINNLTIGRKLVTKQKIINLNYFIGVGFRSLFINKSIITIVLPIDFKLFIYQIILLLRLIVFLGFSVN